MDDQHQVLTSQAKWNQRHQQRSLPVPACRVLEAHREILPSTGHALDLACGLGGNAILLAESGLSCTALDISDIALTRLHNYANKHNLAIYPELVDLEASNFSLAPKQYDVIVVSYFLYRPLLPKLVSALKPGGLLFYQTFVDAGSKGQIGPRNKDFYLRKNELLAQFQDLDVRYYCEHTNNDSIKVNTEAHLVACKLSTLNS
jgi:SAM-dependent methyltransferase